MSFKGFQYEQDAAKQQVLKRKWNAGDLKTVFFSQEVIGTGAGNVNATLEYEMPFNGLLVGLDMNILEEYAYDGQVVVAATLLKDSLQQILGFGPGNTSEDVIIAQIETNGPAIFQSRRFESSADPEKAAGIWCPEGSKLIMYVEGGAGLPAGKKGRAWFNCFFKNLY